MNETGTAKQRARATKLHTTVEKPSDTTYVDRTETSLRVTFNLPGQTYLSQP
jgi:hypothetical protein